MSTDGPTTPARRLVVVLSLLLALGACGGDDQPQEDLDLPEAASSTSPDDGATPDDRASANPGVPEPSAPPEKGDRVRQRDAGVYALQLPSEQPAKQVGETLVDYMSVRVQAYNTGALDLAGLSAVAIGEPLQTVQTRVLELEQQGLHTVGDIWIALADGDVTVKGGTARFEDVCMLNASVDANGKNIAAETPPPSYVGSGRAKRFGRDVWVIDELSFDPVPKC